LKTGVVVAGSSFVSPTTKLFVRYATHQFKASQCRPSLHEPTPELQQLALNFLATFFSRVLNFLATFFFTGRLKQQPSYICTRPENFYPA